MILQIFSQFVVAPTRSIINAMDLKNFHNIIMLLKAGRFEAFSYQSNNDELVINSMSGCNCNNCKLNNNNYKLTNNLAWKQCSLTLSTIWFKSQIPFTYSYLSTKFVVFPIKSKGDMHDSLKHVLMLCCQSYLSIWNNLLLH